MNGQSKQSMAGDLYIEIEEPVAGCLAVSDKGGNLVVQTVRKLVTVRYADGSTATWIYFRDPGTMLNGDPQWADDYEFFRKAELGE